MGMPMSTLKWVAPTSWIIDLAAQIYGMTSTPSMVDYHNANMSYFSPQPYLIAAFFTPQQLLQVVWLYRLITLPSPSSPQSTAQSSAELRMMTDYVPIYSFGNLCIASWMLLWNNGRLDLSSIAVWASSLAQLAYLTGAAGNLGRMNTRSTSSVLTHLNAKTFAGIGVLDLLHNTAAAFARNHTASTFAKVATGVGFAAASASSDWIFGSCLVYDLVALSVGQRDYDPGWSKLLAAYAVGSAAIVGLKNWFREKLEDKLTSLSIRPPYTSQPDDYEGLAYGDDQ